MADILVLAGPIWLGDNSSVMKQVHERLYGGSYLLNDAGQYLYYGRVGGCLITGNEDGIKHCAQNVLYTLQHIINPNSLGQQQHPVNTSDGCTDVRRQPVDSSNENGDIYR